jgi:hypothetical protein
LFAISTFAITEEITLVGIADKNLEMPVEPFLRLANFHKLLF